MVIFQHWFIKREITGSLTKFSEWINMRRGGGGKNCVKNSLAVDEFNV